MLLFGLDRSRACRRVVSVLRRERRVRELIESHFELVLVDVADDANRAALRRYGDGVRRQGTPVLALLSPVGTVSASRGPRVLLEGDYPDTDALLRVLRGWRGAPPPARRSNPAKRRERPRMRTGSAPSRLR